MSPNIVASDLTVLIAVEIVTELLRFILIKIEFHVCPFSDESPMRGKGYPRKAGQFGVGHVLYGTKFNHEFSHPAEDRPTWDIGPKAA